MKLRRSLIAIIVLLLLLAQSAAAELKPLPMDSDVGGNPWKEENMIGKDEYQDESLHVVIERIRHQGHWMIIARATIKDPSQLRTAASYGTYDDHRYVKVKLMTKSVNSVLAMDGDFFKYHDFGYVVRQGTLYRDCPDGEHDVLLIDNYGDFHALKYGTLDTINAAVAAFEDGRHVVNSFNFGPILVLDGQPQDVAYKFYQPSTRQQRIAIAQTGELSYAIIQAEGMTDGSKGFTLKQFAAAIAELVPETKVAFNLDGGGSAYVIFADRKLNDNDGARAIADIIYFASIAE